MEAGFEEDVEYVCDFEEGDKVVYPAPRGRHGAEERDPRADGGGA